MDCIRPFSFLLCLPSWEQSRFSRNLMGSFLGFGLSILSAIHLEFKDGLKLDLIRYRLEGPFGLKMSENKTGFFGELFRKKSHSAEKPKWGILCRLVVPR